MEGGEKHGLVSCIWVRYGALIRLGITLFLVTFCGRWGEPWIGKLHLSKVWCPDKVRYHPSFGYILWKVGRTMDWWVASEDGMVPCVRLGISPCFWFHPVKVRSTMDLVCCYWERYGALNKVRYSHPSFGYILLKVGRTMDWWVASEDCMVPCIRLGTLTLFWLHSVEGGEKIEMVSCIWRWYGALRKVRFLTSIWLHSVEGGENHGLVSCIWGRYGASL